MEHIIANDYGKRYITNVNKQMLIAKKKWYNTNVALDDVIRVLGFVTAMHILYKIFN